MRLPGLIPILSLRKTISVIELIGIAQTVPEEIIEEVRGETGEDVLQGIETELEEIEILTGCEIVRAEIVDIEITIEKMNTVLPVIKRE